MNAIQRTCDIPFSGLVKPDNSEADKDDSLQKITGVALSTLQNFTSSLFSKRTLRSALITITFMCLIYSAEGEIKDEMRFCYDSCKAISKVYYSDMFPYIIQRECPPLFGSFTRCEPPVINQNGFKEYYATAEDLFTQGSLVGQQFFLSCVSSCLWRSN